MLRKQKVFRDEITAVVSGEREVVTSSFWDEKENAEAYNTSGYPQVLTSLGKVLEGAPHVRTLEVVSSTFTRSQLAPQRNPVASAANMAVHARPCF